MFRGTGKRRVLDMIQQQGIGWSTPFRSSRVAVGALALAVAGTVAIGAVVAVNLAATRAPAAAAPAAAPRFNTGDGTDIQVAVDATKPRLNTGDSVDLQRLSVDAARARLNTGDSIDLQAALYQPAKIGVNVQDFGWMPFAIPAAAPANGTAPAGYPSEDQLSRYVAPRHVSGGGHFVLDSGR
jgi:hypothetical protein